MPDVNAVVSGRMDRTVEIQQLMESEGTSGYPVEAWITLAIVQMERQDVRQVERFQASQLSAPLETLWYLHYRADMDPAAVDVVKKRRLVYQGRVFDITSAREIGRQRGLELRTLASAAVPA